MKIVTDTYWQDIAIEKTTKENDQVKGQKERIMAGAVLSAIHDFCIQNQTFAKAVAEGGSFAECMNAVPKNIGESHDILETRMADAQQRAITLSRQQTALYDNAALSTEEFWRQHGELAKQIQAANDEYAELQMQLLANHDQQEILNEAIKTGSEVVAANSAEAQACTDAYKQMQEEYATTSESVAENSQNMADATAEASQKMQEEYAALYASAHDSLNKQIGLFDDLSGKCEISMDEMIENLKTQQEAFDNYATNIQLAMERGIDIGLA